MVSILNGLGLDGTIILKQAAAETNKGRLRVNGEEARSRGHLRRADLPDR